jgi:hypothetical protein
VHLPPHLLSRAPGEKPVGGVEQIRGCSGAAVFDRCF